MLTTEHLIQRQRGEIASVALKAVAEKGAAYLEARAGSVPSTLQNTHALPATVTDENGNEELAAWGLGDVMEARLA